MPICVDNRKNMSQANPYASFVAADDPLAIIRSTPSWLTSLITGLTPEQQKTQPAPGKWSTRDIICHLADTEIGFGFRLRQILAEPHHTIQPFDQDRWSAPYHNFSAEEALSAFSALRNWNVHLIERLPKESFAKPATHPERGDLTFGTIVETMAGHDRHHLRQIEKLVPPK